MVPISTFVTLTERAVAPELGREAQLRSVPITARLTPDFALGAALTEVQRLAAELLRRGHAHRARWPRRRRWAKARRACW